MAGRAGLREVGTGWEEPPVISPNIILFKGSWDRTHIENGVER